MPTPRKNITLSKTPPIVIGDDGRMVLTPQAAALYEEITTRWTLTPPVESLVRLHCEQLSIATLCDRVVAVEGCTIRDAKGSLKSHPLVPVAAASRVAAAASINKVLGCLA